MLQNLTNSRSGHIRFSDGYWKQKIPPNYLHPFSFQTGFHKDKEENLRHDREVAGEGNWWQQRQAASRTWFYPHCPSEPVGLFSHSLLQLCTYTYFTVSFLGVLIGISTLDLEFRKVAIDLTACYHHLGSFWNIPVQGPHPRAVETQTAVSLPLNPRVECWVREMCGHLSTVFMYGRNGTRTALKKWWGIG